MFYWDFALIFLALGVLIPWRGAVRVRQLLARPEISSADRLTIYASTIGFQWLLTGIVAWRALAHHITSENLGLILPSPRYTALVAAAFVLVLGGLQLVGIRRTASMPPGEPSRIRDISLRLMPASLVEALAFSALAVTASICEEFLYRGFVFAALALATHSVALAAVGSSVLFALAHLYQGRRGLITTFVLGIIFAASRIATGNILPAVAAHLVIDLLAGCVAPRYLRRQSAAAVIVFVDAFAGRKSTEL